MSDAGSALMGIGRASGDNRAIEAARAAIDSPLLELSIDGAKGILFNITGGPDMGMYEIDEAAKAITEASDPDANIIFGAIIDEAMSGEIKITVIATGFEMDRVRESKNKSMGMGMSAGTGIGLGGLPSQRSTYGVSPSYGGLPSSMSTMRQTPPPQPMMPEPMPQQDDNLDDELEVPAFIRRKLK
jgi:hypothetical protein